MLADFSTYAGKANEHMRRKYYNMIFRGKKANVAKAALARELACFIWGMMNEKFITLSICCRKNNEGYRNL